MLLRNINSDDGLCNGTRCLFKSFTTNLIELEILQGSLKGKLFFLPKMNLTTLGNDVPFKLRRFQFPIRLSFCMTINKSQDQTFNKIGIFLPDDLFSHGKLYVAFSRVSSFSNIKIQANSNFI
jgi:ATP-dependent DNA helicase PIF1